MQIIEMELKTIRPACCDNYAAPSISVARINLLECTTERASARGFINKNPHPSGAGRTHVRRSARHLLSPFDARQTTNSDNKCVYAGAERIAIAQLYFCKTVIVFYIEYLISCGYTSKLKKNSNSSIGNTGIASPSHTPQYIPYL